MLLLLLHQLGMKSEDVHLHTKLVLVFFDSSIKCLLQHGLFGDKAASSVKAHYQPLEVPD